MDIEFTNYLDDLSSDWAVAKKTDISNLVKRCLIKGIIKKEAFKPLLAEIENWDGGIV